MSLLILMEWPNGKRYPKSSCIQRKKKRKKEITADRQKKEKRDRHTETEKGLSSFFQFLGSLILLRGALFYVKVWKRILFRT